MHLQSCNNFASEFCRYDFRGHTFYCCAVNGCDFNHDNLIIRLPLVDIVEHFLEMHIYKRIRVSGDGHHSQRRQFHVRDTDGVGYDGGGDFMNGGVSVADTSDSESDISDDVSDSASLSSNVSDST